MSLMGLKELLLNMFFILTPVLLFFFFEPKKRTLNIRIVFLASLSAVLCMLFPFSIFPGIIFDLRLIPFIISFLYGGYRTGLSVWMIIILARFLIGGAGIWGMLSNQILIVPVLCYFAKYFQQQTKKRKLVSAALLALFASLMTITSYFIQLNFLGLKNQNHLFFFSFTILLIVGMILTIYLIEVFLENNRMKAEIIHNEKLQLVSELAASIAHEIRNPLTIVKGFTQMLGVKYTDNKKQQAYFHLMVNELDRAEKIISDYLSFAKPEVGKTEIVDLSKLIQQSVDLLESYAVSCGTKFEISLKNSLWIEANSSQLIQAFMNIMKNGIESMYNGGAVKIATYRINDLSVVEIKDTGIGMSEEETNRLGRPYYTTKANGTGLSMMVTYRIIQAMKGTIEVQSQVGKGTCFYVKFPSVPDLSGRQKG